MWMFRVLSMGFLCDADRSWLVQDWEELGSARGAKCWSLGLWKLAAVLMGQLKSVCAIQMRMLGRRTSNIHSVAFLSYDAACSCWIEEERGVGKCRSLQGQVRLQSVHHHVWILIRVCGATDARWYTKAGRSQGVWPEAVIPLGHVGTPISHRNCQFRSAGAETWNKTHPNSSSSSSTE